MKTIVSLLLFVFLIMNAGAQSVREESPGLCGKGFFVEGEIKHFKTPKEVQVEGATDKKMYIEEVYGNLFVAGVEGLPEGDYTVEVYLVEAHVKSVGNRIMNIEAEGRKIAEKLDIFAQVGFGRELVVSGKVHHAADAINGPFKLTFSSTREKAKFNAIKVKDAAGNVVACVCAVDLLSQADVRSMKVPDIKTPAIYLDPSQPLNARIDDLASRMSLNEKVNQLMNAAPAIERLKVPAYDYWNECLHGVARAGYATVFPQAIGLAAMWDEPLMHEIGDTIATEGRAKANVTINQFQDTKQYDGLTYWTPNINIFRDPRWGRGQETYGEDPFLTGRLGVAFVKGLQGDDPRYLKAMACAKHFAVHSGPESLRHSFDARPPERDLYETYLPQFEMVVRESQPGQVMSAYNALNGVPAPADKWLLTDLLRGNWGYKGLVVSDCGGINDIHAGHHFTKNPAESSATAIKAGNDLNCGGTYRALTQAVFDGLITEQEIDVSLKRVLEARFKLGMFDPPTYAYAKIPATELNTPGHDALALKAARESIVLLRNNGLLPLTAGKARKIVVIGANADSKDVLYGNYHGEAVAPVTILAGIKKEFADAEVTYVKGCPLAVKPDEKANEAEYNKAIEAAKAADLVIYVGGLSPGLEGEEMRTQYVGFAGGDRVTIELPEVQEQMLKDLLQANKSLIFINCTGSAIAMPWEAGNIPAIVQAWYSGQEGGTAVAEVLSGKVNPSGKLPVTFYASTKDLPDFENYSMDNRTYRYFTGKALFPFGYGLSYTKFEFQNLSAESKQVAANGEVKLTVQVRNTGGRDGDEIVQVYVRALQGKKFRALQELMAFQRVSLKAGESKQLAISVPAGQLRYWDTDVKGYKVEAGDYEFAVGSSSADLPQKLIVGIGK
ncbi:MAG: glycoside hydrolase family 3 C-terminal domain-containing protein [Verrucomicrobiales bacterium]|jgi:beta-glucosidase|nr:glycoside hydrolase family 3 C-terminal domain-containing protein [Verrucomicrobiales bacterium]